MLLRRHGVECNMAGDGAEAVQIVQSSSQFYDLIFMDNFMPVMVNWINGWTTLIIIPLLCIMLYVIVMFGSNKIHNWPTLLFLEWIMLLSLAISYLIDKCYDILPYILSYWYMLCYSALLYAATSYLSLFSLSYFRMEWRPLSIFVSRATPTSS